MSKAIRTGSIYRMVGMLVAAAIALALAAPMATQILLKQGEDQDAMIAARPEARPAKPVASKVSTPPPPQAPVVFGAPTMPAAPMDPSNWQQPQQQAAMAPAPSANASPTPAPTPSRQASLSAPAPSPDLGIDPNVTAPRVIPPPAQPSRPKPQMTGGRTAKIE